ncbi:MAG: hypothetical protein V4857_14455 [Pseudomonadota bacterium]
MLPTVQIQHFWQIFESWKYSYVHVNVAFIAVRELDSWKLLSSKVELSPYEFVDFPPELIKTSQLFVGQILERLTTEELTDFMASLQLGGIKLKHTSIFFPDPQNLSTYAPVGRDEPNHFTPQLEVRCEPKSVFLQEFELARTNAELRCGDVPFDGLGDLLSFFGFGSAGSLPQELKISVKLHPPADLQIEHCSLSQNKLKLRIKRRTPILPERLSVGLRQFPKPSFDRRSQIGERIVWGSGDGGFDLGTLEMDLKDCATAEIMLSVDGHSARRWFLFDPHKSLNPRLTDYRFFDPHLTHLKKSLTFPKDARQLEVGTAALMHLLGASSLNPPGSDTPDVIVETPRKQIALIECTVRVDNVREKTGKLVGRREGLMATESKYGINREIMCILLVNQPVASLVNERSFLSEHRVVLLTLEDITAALENLELPPDLDDLFHWKFDEMRTMQFPLFGASE